MSYLYEELKDEFGRIKTALEKRSVITVKVIKDKHVAVIKAALQKLPAKIDCPSLQVMKDNLADSHPNSNIKMLVT